MRRDILYEKECKYEDGTPYYCIGTTCYVWELQPDEIIKRTLKMLQNGAFNKLRFCLFPKHYCYNLKEPRAYPYEGNLEHGWGNITGEEMTRRF